MRSETQECTTDVASDGIGIAMTGAFEAVIAALVALALCALVISTWRRRGGGLLRLLAGLVAVASLWAMRAPLMVEREVSLRTVRLVTADGDVASPGIPSENPAEASSVAKRSQAAPAVGARFSDDLGIAARTAEIDAGSAPGRFGPELLEAFAVADGGTASRARVVGDGGTASRARLVPDVRWLLRNRPEVTAVRVSGHGLLAAEWSGLAWRVAAEPPPPLARGVKSLAWSRQLDLGSELVVRGALSACTECREVRLEGAATVAGDRGALAVPDADGAFELRVRPRAVGRFLLEIVAVDALGAALVRQTVDVVVTAPRPPAVLWLEHAPSFESRAVRRWREQLAKSERTARDGGAALQDLAAAALAGGFEVRSTWSRGRVRTSLLSEPTAPPQPRAFAEFDVVVMDAESLRGLGAAPTQALRQAVREDGVGLLLRLDEGRLPEREPLLAGFGVQPVADLDELLARVAWPGFEAALPLAIAGRELVNGAESAPLAVDQAGRVLAARRFAGAGAVAVSLLQGTYRFALAGDRDTHARLWSHLLQAVARARLEAWHLPSRPALVDSPFDLAFTAARPPGNISCREPDGASVVLPLATSREEPRRVRARLWPRLGGWHTCTATGAGTRTDVTFYAHSASSWSVWLDARRQDDTAVAAAMTAAPAGDGAESRRPPVRRPAELPRWPFFGVFLMSVGYLWVAERWGSSLVAPSDPRPD